MPGVGEFAGEIGAGLSFIGVEVGIVLVGALIQPRRDEVIRMNATIRRNAILIIIISCCVKRNLPLTRAFTAILNYILTCWNSCSSIEGDLGLQESDP